VKPALAEQPHYQWMWPNKDFAYIGVPKCGSVTMRESFGLKTIKGVTRDKVLSMSRRLAVVRHPVDRIFSAHRYGWKDVPFDEWWRHTKKNPHWDVHTYPIVDWLQDDATEIRALEQIAQWWHEYTPLFPSMPKDPPQLNKGTWERDERYVDSILSLYYADYLLYVRACRVLRVGTSPKTLVPNCLSARH